MNSRDETPIPADVMHAMLRDVAPLGPEAATAARVKNKVLRQVAALPLAVRRETGWRPFFPGTEMKVLFDDGKLRSWLVRMQPGSELPPHAHDEGDEECVVLEGEVWVNDLRYGPGDYTVALRGSTHHSVRTIRGALFFLRSPSPRAKGRANAQAG
jgi:quercetin dioxygenase-like cupin family protein